MVCESANLSSSTFALAAHVGQDAGGGSYGILLVFTATVSACGFSTRPARAIQA